jgi:NAD(P)H dehydrogenase (quinone)
MTTESMRIGVSGASGQLGASVVKELKTRAPGAHVVGISRTTEKVTPLGVEARRGDFNDPQALASAYAGLDRLLIIPARHLDPGGGAAQHVLAVETAVKAGVPHVVFVSATGCRPGGLFESYFRPEQALMRLAKHWTVLRMAFYAESFADEAKRTLASGVHLAISSTPVSFVSRDDVAAAAAGLLATEGHHGVIYQATGLAALNGEERAAAVAKASGKPMAFARVAADSYRRGLEAAGLPAPVVGAAMDIQQMWAAGAFDVVTGDVERLSGRRPRALGDVLRTRFS